MNIVVIGAGSVGAHVTYRLAEQGADVTVLDAGVPGHGTTSASIAWLSSFPQMSWTEEPGKARLRTQVHDAFQDLQQEVPGDYVRWDGTLMWGTAADRAAMTEAAEVCRRRGVDVQTIDGTGARRIEPSVAAPDDEVVFWEPGSGWVDGPLVVRSLLAAAEKLGATVLPGTRVTGLDSDLDGGTVRAVRTDSGRRIEVDAVVNAAGAWGSHVAALADLAVPLDLVPGRVVYTAPLRNCPKVVVNAPEWSARPDPSGGLAVHWRGGPQEPGHGANIRTGQQVVDEVARVIPELAGSRPVRSGIGIRPIPPGGPIVGSLPWMRGMYFALSHGGIGWGPTWGWMAARELLHGESVPELSAMRPDRFYLEPAAIGRYADDAEQVAGEVRPDGTQGWGR